MELMSRLLDRLRKEIVSSPKTRYRLSEETGITQGHLSHFVKGEKGVSFETFELLADHLGLEIIVRRKRRKGRR
jgi:transcriptional regulator with XRE-family HTH domain